MHTPTRQSASARAIVAMGRSPARLVQIYGPGLGSWTELASPGPMVIGRDLASDLRVELDSVSRRHCSIFSTDGAHFIRDLGSTNGTYVNGVRIGDAVQLKNGDQVRVGAAVLKFLFGDATGSVEAHFHETIYRLAITDGLTGLSNRRHLLDFLERELSRCARHERPMSVVLIDIDYFKVLNDAFGHLVGDAVLRELASVLRGRARREECVARYGGEEFCMVFPEATPADAVQRAEALREFCANHLFSSAPLKMTVSIGVAAAIGDQEARTLIASADAALYRAKHLGRNRVVLAEPGEAAPATHRL